MAAAYRIIERSATYEPESYNTPYLGYKFYKETAKLDPWYGHNVPMHGLYRWHLPDSIRFEKDLRVTSQQIETANGEQNSKIHRSPIKSALVDRYVRQLTM
ncbi:DUF2961 domain-containing protein [Paenibacillus sp. HJGM_3]|uniref:DUF2961 domain-containing protein n=1 Tax=Paenibacillus sp. HJGM_3 TaxID=3379816 RepID=UPI00385FB87D